MCLESPRKALRRASQAALVPTVRALHRELGTWGVLRVLAWVVVLGVFRDPYRHLPRAPKRDERDRLSRQQSRELILLDRALRRVVRGADAEPKIARILRVAVSAAGAVFLDAMVPNVSHEELLRVGPALAERFFNAEGTAQAHPDGSFTFVVTRCRFVELLRSAGASHLTPLFCEVDHAFFTGARDTHFERPTTLAAGQACCDFRWRSRAR